MDWSNFIKHLKELIMLIPSADSGDTRSLLIVTGGENWNRFLPAGISSLGVHLGMLLGVPYCGTLPESNTNLFRELLGGNCTGGVVSATIFSSLFGYSNVGLKKASNAMELTSESPEASLRFSQVTTSIVRRNESESILSRCAGV
jgi:hypothetical protein